MFMKEESGCFINCFSAVELQITCLRGRMSVVFSSCVKRYCFTREKHWGVDSLLTKLQYYSGCTNRKDEVIINRLRMGHTRLTHSFRMENRPHPPLCDQCEGDHELTVKHIWIECNFLKIIHRRHYDVTDLNQLFTTVSSKRILDFVKDIGLYNSL